MRNKYNCLNCRGWTRATRSVTPIVPTVVGQTKARSRPATMSKQHCRMLQCRMLLRQSRTLLRHCCRFWQQCRSNVRLCCQKRQHCRSNRNNNVACCFDNVSSTLLLVWTGLKLTRRAVAKRAEKSAKFSIWGKCTPHCPTPEKFFVECN